MRTIEQQRIYDNEISTRQDGDCVFCNIDNQEIVEVFENFTVVKNKYPYSFWDMCFVKNHYLLVPNKHIDSFTELSKDENEQRTGIEARYMLLGYNVYTRSPKNSQKSVIHLHTHFIEVGGVIKFLFYSRVPYVAVVDNLIKIKLILNKLMK